MAETVQAGERWYVKHKGGVALKTYYVHEVTDKTVVVGSIKAGEYCPSEQMRNYDPPIRYDKSDLIFVEKCDE